MRKGSPGVRTSKLERTDKKKDRTLEKKGECTKEKRDNMREGEGDETGEEVENRRQRDGDNKRSGGRTQKKEKGRT